MGPYSVHPYLPNTTGVFTPEVGGCPLPGYKLLRLRGHGGFATVWEAETPTGEHIALKFMSSAAAGTTAREVRSIQQIQAVEHPSLLRIREVWSVPGCIVIGMDLAEASLLDLFELYVEEFRRPIEIEKLGQYLGTIAHALDFLNARKHRIDSRLVGLQHGDIKPNNILLVDDKALLADYGLATPTAGPYTPCPRHGTAEYCPPEVFHGTLTERSDQFSLAVTYHVLRTGMFPFPPPPSQRESLRNYVRPEPNLTHLPPAERPIVARALSVTPQNRYPTCVEFLTQLLTVNRLESQVLETGSVLVRPVTDSMLLGRAQMFR